MDFKLSPTSFSRYDHIIPFLIYISTLISFTLDLRKQRKNEMTLKDACTQRNKEKKLLTRNTLLLTDKDNVDEGVDAGESANDADIETLNKTIKQLSTEVVELQTELDSVRQNEFETLEQNAKLSEKLEIVKSGNRSLRTDIEELQKGHSQLLRVSELMQNELGDMRKVHEDQRSDILELRKEAEEQKKERNILAHQRNLLLQGLSKENGTDSLILLLEIESLKRRIEDERTRYEEELKNLQERLEDYENTSNVEILEERLTLVEAKLQEAITRAECKAHPPPPPPPPPLPLFPIEQQPVVRLRRKKSRTTLEDLARTICVQETTTHKKPPAAPGVNEIIINAIKEGKFTLRKKENNNEPKEKDEEAPKAVSEILNTLGSLRRVSKKRQSQYIGGLPQFS